MKNLIDRAWISSTFITQAILLPLEEFKYVQASPFSFLLQSLGSRNLSIQKFTAKKWLGKYVKIS